MNINYEMFEKFREFESERLLFRRFKKEDAKDLFLLRSNEETMRYVDIPVFTSIEDAEKMIESCEKDYQNREIIAWAVIEKQSNQFMGHYSYLRISHKHCRGEVGYIISPQFWNKGFMTEALIKMIPVAFNELNFHTVEADVNPANEASKRVLEKRGFKKEAYFRENYLFDGKFLDTLVYSLLERDFIGG